jgi:hypothetical protein
VVVDRAVVHGPRVHGAPVIHADGYVIWTIDLRSGSPGGLQAKSGGARPTCGGTQPGLHRKFAGEGILELLCTKTHAVWTGMKRRTVRTSPESCGRPWGTREDVCR